MPLDNFLRLLDDFLGSRLVSRGGSIGRGSMTVSLLGLRGVDGSSLVCDISNESVVVVSSVGGGLDSAVGKSNNEATSDNTIAILALGLLEVGLAVVISNSILIGERLRGKLLLLVGSRLVGRGWGVSRGWGVRHRNLVGDGDSHESSGESNLRKNEIKRKVLIHNIVVLVNN